MNETSKEYPLTGNSTRDQVRKLLFESFQADQQAPLANERVSISQVVEGIENEILSKTRS